MPVLQVGDEALFESAVINEYLDETNGDSYHPADPLLKAKNRAWIEFISQILMDQYRNSVAADEADFHRHLDTARAKIERLETVHTGPYFNGANFSLVDAAIAPAFTRFAVLDEALQAIDPQLALNLYAKAPKVGKWARLLTERESVKDSVVPEFRELYLNYIKEHGKYAGSLLNS